jgi:hypothetical protein
MSGSKPGERRGGRQKGTPNKVTRTLQEAILQALDEAGGAPRHATRQISWDWKQRPLHSWESHGADALRYFATGFDDTPSALAPRRRDSEPRSGTHWSY